MLFLYQNFNCLPQNLVKIGAVLRNIDFYYFVPNVLEGWLKTTPRRVKWNS